MNKRRRYSGCLQSLSESSISLKHKFESSMPHTKGRESLGSNVITLCILWKWWARKGLNLGPRDYESPIPFVYVTES